MKDGCTASTTLGWVFSIQRFSIHDGPGIRTTVFLKGCPLRCEWCHNPEGLEAHAQVRLAMALCAHCGRCADACEHGGHSVTTDSHTLHLENCIVCGRCAEACPAGALEVVGSRMSVEDALAVVRRDIPFYDQSGGGMTLSGGEPMAQYAFTSALLRAAHAEGLHTAVETSAFVSWDRLEALLDVVDLWMVDLKHTSSTRHRELTGVPNEAIMANLQALAATGRPLMVRVPWVPTRNADEGFLEALTQFLPKLPGSPPVEFMPYHRLGLGKWESLGRLGSMDPGIPAATPDDVRPWIERLADVGVRAEVN